MNDNTDTHAMNDCTSNANDTIDTIYRTDTHSCASSAHSACSSAHSACSSAHSACSSSSSTTNIIANNSNNSIWIKCNLSRKDEIDISVREGYYDDGYYLVKLTKNQYKTILEYDNARWLDNRPRIKKTCTSNIYLFHFGVYDNDLLAEYFSKITIPRDDPHKTVKVKLSIQKISDDILIKRSSISKIENIYPHPYYNPYAFIQNPTTILLFFALIIAFIGVATIPFIK